MKRIKVDLSESFESILKCLSSVPKSIVADEDLPSPSNGSGMRKESILDSDLKMALRALYEAANGRQVETHLGLITIAPPTAEFLKDTPFYIQTQLDFFVAAIARLIARASSDRNGTADLTSISGTSFELRSEFDRPARAATPCLLGSKRLFLNSLMIQTKKHD